MPHSTSHSTGAGGHLRAASQSRSSAGRDLNGGSGQGQTEKFPDFDTGFAFPSGQSSSQRWQQNGVAQGNGSATRGHARRDSKVRWAPREVLPSSLGHSKKNSISNAVHRMRSASMSQNAQEIAGALRAPVSWTLVVRIQPMGRESTPS